MFKPLINNLPFFWLLIRRHPSNLLIPLYLHIMQINMNNGNRKKNAENPKIVDRDEMARVIHAAWVAGLIPQKSTCSELSIDQGQFSKIVNGKFRRTTGHAAALYTYSDMQIRGNHVVSVVSEGVAAQQLVQAVLTTWDKTEAGAQALSTAIKAMGRLQEVARRRR